MSKYKNLLYEKIKSQLLNWFESEPDRDIPNEEVYRFLHSIKGTSGTIGMVGLHQTADRLLEKSNEDSDKLWKPSDLRDFLYELVRLSYEYENFQTVLDCSSINRKGDVPLIQVIDDDISMVVLLKDALEEQGWMVLANTNPTIAINQYYDLHPDCLIIDVNLPMKNGFQLLEEIQGNHHKRFIPKIMMSIQNDRETRIAAYKSGADDFLSKPIDLEEFIVRVERHLERKKIFDQSVLIDELTQVYNRRHLASVLESSLDELKRQGGYFSVAIIDLDHFKQVNDTYGHLMGDHVLVHFAQFLKERVRSTDHVFRYGGEEFVVLFPGTTGEETKAILERILAEFSKTIISKSEIEITATFSAGGYMVSNHETSANTIIESADLALYKAKENGRARVEMACSHEVIVNKKPLFISVIDDDIIIRTMLMKILQSMDIEGVSFDLAAYEDGSKFFDSERHIQIGQHFLILDGIMPVMDGTEVLQKVKLLPNANQFQVLMLTGRKNEKDIARALKLGADDYVTKPFSMTELQARIHRLIKRMV
ncbi:diguanylate cyclase [Falsibacillus albus]|uniref:Diguanylate cyclase n=2 Tax=Falsibacillus albus TaxID=2478915 RepID=A0A3L7JZP5_9BACI|nr:diguanylate cyclase [Falsibacillus albus]